MTCPECQQAITTYDLLDVSKHQQMEQHKMQCTACTQFWQEMVSLNEVLKKVAPQKIQEKDPAALTNRIMTSVLYQRKPEKISTWLETLMQSNFTRLSLSGVSICLVILLLVEIGNTPISETPKRPVAGLPVILNSQDFRKAFNTGKREKKSLLRDCLNSKNKVDINCLKSKVKF